MQETKAIKIAGLSLAWSPEYANIYRDYLVELGYETKIISVDQEGNLVAYSVRNFSRSEAMAVLSSLRSSTSDTSLPQGENNEKPQQEESS